MQLAVFPENSPSTAHAVAPEACVMLHAASSPEYSAIFKCLFFSRVFVSIVPGKEENGSGLV